MTARARRGGGLPGTRGGIAVLAALLLIASGLATGCRHPRVAGTFWADAEYPQLFLQFTLFEVPAETLALAPLGSLRTAAPDGASGISSAPRVECVSAASVDELFRSISECPGARDVFCPALVSAPGAPAAVELNSVDKAGASSGKFSIAATGWLDDEGLTIDVLLRGDVGDGCATGVRRVGEGMALILACPAADGAATRALLVVRPKVVRTPNDAPVQRAGPAGT